MPGEMQALVNNENNLDRIEAFSIDLASQQPPVFILAVI